MSRQSEGVNAQFTEKGGFCLSRPALEDHDANDTRLQFITGAFPQAQVNAKLFPHQRAIAHEMMLWESACAPRSMPLEDGEYRGGDPRQNVNMDGVDLMNQRPRLAEPPEVYSRIGILGGAVGSGKTHSVLGHVQAHPHPPPLRMTRFIPVHDTTTVGNVPMVHTTIIKPYRTSRTGVQIPCTLVIVPHFLVEHWRTVAEDELSMQTVVAASNVNIPTLEQVLGAQVIICSSTCWATFYRMLRIEGAPGTPNVITDVEFLRVIVDECDSIGLHRISVRARFVWFVTASVQAARRTALVKDCTQLAQFERLKFYTHIACHPEFIEQSMAIPDYIIRELVFRQTSDLHALTAAGMPVPDNIIQAFNEGSPAEALGMLANATVSTVQQILEKHLASLRDDLQASEHQLQNLYQMQALGGRRDLVNRIQTDITKTSADIERLKDKIATAEESLTKPPQCPICMDDVHEGGAMVECCQRWFHAGCIMQWLNTSQACPWCRYRPCLHRSLVFARTPSTKRKHPDSTNLGDVAPMEDDNDDGGEGSEQNSNADASTEKFVSFHNKPDAAVEILRKHGKEGVVLFCTNEHVMYRMVEECKDMGLNAKKLFGMTGRAIKNVVKNFANPEARPRHRVDVVILSSNTQVAGLNLQRAKHVIVMRHMDKETWVQAVGRAQRFGRTCRLTVWYLRNTQDPGVRGEPGANTHVVDEH